jgi:hypothetical protein
VVKRSLHIRSGCERLDSEPIGAQCRCAAADPRHGPRARGRQVCKGAPAPSLKMTQPTIPAFTTVEVDFAKYASLDERARLDLVLMVACYVCTQHTEPQGTGPRA